MLEGIERILLDRRPDYLLVYGDTNSTLAGALAAAKLHIPIAHVEAGLRSFNRRMPEEINRVLTDQLSALLFVPSDSGIANLRAEGITCGVVRTGDVMYDTVQLFQHTIGAQAAPVLQKYDVTAGGFALATVHRAENTDDEQRWGGIVAGLEGVAAHMPVLWPVHPRVKERLAGYAHEAVRLLPPLSYFEMQALLAHARVMLTDSGGMQKEAAFHHTPCVTLRDETEWVELVENGYNTLAGAEAERIVAAALAARWSESVALERLYGDGQAADHIATVLLEHASRE